MNDADRAIDSVLSDLDRVASTLKRGRSAQLEKDDERALLRTLALSWSRRYRSAIASHSDATSLAAVDEAFAGVLPLGDRRSSRTNCLGKLRAAREKLARLRTIIAFAKPNPGTREEPPDFARHVVDAEMQAILVRRWNETQLCLHAGAPLAATVMMGGLLEGLLLAKINRQPDKTPIFTASRAPRDREKKTLPIGQWTLANFIDVAEELGWISSSAKSVGVVVRDYRNFIHPQKEHSHKVTVTIEDARVIWIVFRSIAEQLAR